MDTLFLDYENSLIGRKKHVSAYNFYGSEAGGANQQRALSCIRYCIEKVLKWDMEEAVKKFDDYMIREMKLDRVLSYINWPIEVNYGDPRYILSLLYPDRVRINVQTLTEEIYKSVLRDERQFPREYFSGADGFQRFCICLKYLIETYRPVSSLDEMYDFFLSPDGKKVLYKYRLKVPADQFDVNIIDCLHFITRDDPDSDLFYSYYMFKEKAKKLANIFAKKENIG